MLALRLSSEASSSFIFLSSSWLNLATSAHGSSSSLARRSRARDGYCVYDAKDALAAAISLFSYIESSL